MDIRECVYGLGNVYIHEHGRAYTHVHMPTWYLCLNVWPNNYFCVLGSAGRWSFLPGMAVKGLLSTGS